LRFHIRRLNVGNFVIFTHSRVVSERESLKHAPEKLSHYHANENKEDERDGKTQEKYGKKEVFFVLFCVVVNEREMLML
jgi:hypothetical protein